SQPGMWWMSTIPGNGPLPDGRATYAWILSPPLPEIVITSAVMPSEPPVSNEFHMVMPSLCPRDAQRFGCEELLRLRDPRDEPLGVRVPEERLDGLAIRAEPVCPEVVRPEDRLGPLHVRVQPRQRDLERDRLPQILQGQVLGLVERLLQRSRD